MKDGGGESSGEDGAGDTGDAPPADDGTPPADDGTPPADDGTPPADDGTPAPC